MFGKTNLTYPLIPTHTKWMISERKLVGFGIVLRSVSHKNHKFPFLSSDED